MPKETFVTRISAQAFACGYIERHGEVFISKDPHVRSFTIIRSHDHPKGWARAQVRTVSEARRIAALFNKES